MYPRYRGTNRKLVLQDPLKPSGFFYVQEDLVPGELVDVVWLSVLQKVQNKFGVSGKSSQILIIPRKCLAFGITSMRAKDIVPEPGDHG